MLAPEWLAVSMWKRWSPEWPAAVGSFCCLLAIGIVLADTVTGGDSDGTFTPAWKTSPYHRVLDGNGQIIPCRCVFNGQRVPLGTTVCMQTHVGMQIARCDLNHNVTTWVPTGTPCRTSRPAAQSSYGNG